MVSGLSSYFDCLGVKRKTVELRTRTMFLYI